jgi:hypothetical protein
VGAAIAAWAPSASKISVMRSGVRPLIAKYGTAGRQECGPARGYCSRKSQIVVATLFVRSAGCSQITHRIGYSNVYIGFDPIGPSA